MGTCYVTDTMLRAGCLFLHPCFWEWKQGSEVMCALPAEERIWDGLGFFPPGYQHIFAMLLQPGVVVEEVHNQRALPMNVEEV